MFAGHNLRRNSFRIHFIRTRFWTKNQWRLRVVNIERDDPPRSRHHRTGKRRWSSEIIGRPVEIRRGRPITKREWCYGDAISAVRRIDSTARAVSDTISIKLLLSDRPVSAAGSTVSTRKPIGRCRAALFRVTNERPGRRHTREAAKNCSRLITRHLPPPTPGTPVHGRYISRTPQFILATEKHVAQHIQRYRFSH